METKLNINNKKVMFNNYTPDFEIITLENHDAENQEISDTRMGSGKCSICDCAHFEPSTGGQTCIGHNSAGGTCNHFASEHF